MDQHPDFLIKVWLIILRDAGCLLCKEQVSGPACTELTAYVAGALLYGLAAFALYLPRHGAAPLNQDGARGAMHA